jgi:hypothetical protein
MVKNVVKLDLNTSSCMDQFTKGAATQGQAYTRKVWRISPPIGPFEDLQKENGQVSVSQLNRGVCFKASQGAC